MDLPISFQKCPKRIPWNYKPLLELPYFAVLAVERTATAKMAA
jgi:hypothetical protein